MTVRDTTAVEMTSRSPSRSGTACPRAGSATPEPTTPCPPREPSDDAPLPELLPEPVSAPVSAWTGMLPLDAVSLLPPEQPARDRAASASPVAATARTWE